LISIARILIENFHRVSNKLPSMLTDFNDNSGYPRQDKLEDALANKLSTATLEANLNHARDVSRTKGIDKMLKDYDIDVIIGPAESAMTDLAAASGQWQ